MPKVAEPRRAPARKWKNPPLEEAEEGDIVITHSELDAYRQCPLKWFLAYNQRWTKQERPDDHPLTKGILWHEVMDVHYTGLKNIQDGVWAEQQGLDQIARDVSALLWDGPEQTELQKLVWWMYQGHLAKYGRDEQWEILAVEVKFQARLQDPSGVKSRILLKGKLDLVVRDRATGKIWIVDHKSGQNLPDQMELDISDQFSLYSWLLRQAGIPVIGVIHSANRTMMNKGDDPANWDGDKPLISNIKRQTLEQRLRRTLINFGDSELDAIARDAWAVAANAYPEHADFERLPMYSSPDPRNCGWKCDFLEAHLMARKGRPIVSALNGLGFQQHFEERY